MPTINTQKIDDFVKAKADFEAAKLAILNANTPEEKAIASAALDKALDAFNKATFEANKVTL